MAARKPFLLRIDAGVWAEVERWAAEELRSANGQVEFLLREALRRRRGGRGSGGAAGAAIEAAAEVAPDGDSEGATSPGDGDA